MLTIEEEELINCIINNYKKSSDFEQEKNKYTIIISRISNALILNKVRELEYMLKSKYYLEFFHAYQQGYHCDKDIIGNDLFENGVDETIDINSLYAEFNYLCVSNKTHNIKRYIIAYFEKTNNIGMLSNIYKLFEIYNNINYEILKISYLSGYCISHNMNKFNIDSINFTIALPAKEDEQNLTVNMGSKIHHCRKCFEYSQAEMSTLFSIERSSLSKYEKGISKPKIDFLLNFSDYCRINLYDLCSPKVSIEEFKIKYPKSHFETL